MRTKSFLIALVTMMLPLVVCAETATIDGICFNLISSEHIAKVIRKTPSYSGEVNIPGNVIYQGENYSVTSISNGAFEGCSGLTSVTIPNSVTSIGTEAFYNCTGLTSVTIPNSVKFVGIGAFDHTVWYNNQPDGLVYVGKVAYRYKGNKPENTSIVIENGMVGIADCAFQNCSGLTSVTIPSSVTSIGMGAFYNCSGLTSVTIPSSVTSIEAEAFYNCSNLTSVNVTVTDYSTFCNNKVINLIRTTIGKTIQLIDSEGKEITEYIVPNDVTSIGEYAFYNCSGLTSVTIPSSVTSIEAEAFYNCSNLTSVHISDVAAWCNISFGDNSLYIAHHLYLNGEEVIELVIPEGVETVSKCAFRGCSDLTSVTIPNGVISIGEYAFNDCSGLTSVIIPNSVTFIGKAAFGGCSSIQLVKSFITEPYSINKNVFPDGVYRNGTLYIPAGTENLYSRFDGWREFLKIEEMDDSEQQEIPGAEKCATPTISYENNKLIFSCQTEEVKYKYRIEADDAKEGYGNDIQMTKKYKVTVFAIKDGMNRSNAAIMIIGKNGDVNGDNKVDVADHVELTNIILSSETESSENEQ